MEDKIICGIYARVSTDKQGDSVENQVGQAEEFISRMGQQYKLDEDCIFVDNAVSGYYTSVFDREAMKQAIECARKGKMRVLVFKEISRVGRDKQENPAIVGMFEQYGVRVIAINDNYDSHNKDNITFDILSVLAEQESKKTSVRVSSGKKQKARRGMWNTDAPIGYKLNTETKKLEVDPESREIVETIFDLYINHGIGSSLIAQHLNSKGKLTRDGNPFSREPVKRILRNPAYIGNTVYGKKRNELRREYDDSGKMTKRKMQIKVDPKDWTTVEGTHESIIDKKTFYAAQSILSSRGHHRVPRRAYHPLTGILICSKCGEGMVCQKRSSKNKDYRYYICKTYHKYGRGACDQANVHADNLENAVIDIVRARLKKVDVSSIKASTNRNEDIERLNDQLKEKWRAKEKAQKDQVDIFNQRDLFDEKTYQAQMLTLKKFLRAIEEELGIINKQIEAMNGESNQNANIVSYVEGFLSLDREDTDRLRTLLHELIEKITLFENQIDIKYRYALL